jgi:hypothetical protein
MPEDKVYVAAVMLFTKGSAAEYSSGCAKSQSGNTPQGALKLKLGQAYTIKR